MEDISSTDRTELGSASILRQFTHYLVREEEGVCECVCVCVCVCVGGGGGWVGVRGSHILSQFHVSGCGQFRFHQPLAHEIQ